MKGFVLAITTFFTTCFSEIHFHSPCGAQALDAATTSYRPRSSTLLRVRKLVNSEAIALMLSKKADMIATTENKEDKHRALVEELILKYAEGSTNYDWSVQAGSLSIMSYGQESFSYSFSPESMLSFSFPHVMGEFFMSSPSSFSFPHPTMDEFFMSFPSYGGGMEMSFSYPEWSVETEYSFSFPADALSFSLAKLDDETVNSVATDAKSEIKDGVVNDGAENRHEPEPESTDSSSNSGHGSSSGGSGIATDGEANKESVATGEKQRDSSDNSDKEVVQNKNDVKEDGSPPSSGATDKGFRNKGDGISVGVLVALLTGIVLVIASVYMALRRKLQDAVPFGSAVSLFGSEASASLDAAEATSAVPVAV
ncbi:hypothetical protein ACA910_022713 [Epithemia clementina (nom. ined.)]